MHASRSRSRGLGSGVPRTTLAFQAAARAPWLSGSHRAAPVNEPYISSSFSLSRSAGDRQAWRGYTASGLGAFRSVGRSVSRSVAATTRRSRICTYTYTDSPRCDGRPCRHRVSPACPPPRPTVDRPDRGAEPCTSSGCDRRPSEHLPFSLSLGSIRRRSDAWRVI